VSPPVQAARNYTHHRHLLLLCCWSLNDIVLVVVYVATTADSAHDISTHPLFVSDEELLQFSASVSTGQLLTSG